MYVSEIGAQQKCGWARSKKAVVLHHSPAANSVVTGRLPVVRCVLQLSVQQPRDDGHALVVVQRQGGSGAEREDAYSVVGRIVDAVIRYPGTELGPIHEKRTETAALERLLLCQAQVCRSKRVCADGVSEKATQRTQLLAKDCSQLREALWRAALGRHGGKSSLTGGAEPPNLVCASCSG